MVVAGPGTGKTELLSMRAANILKKTDSLPENILCLTFTDSGAATMRARLVNIIGPAAYKVSVHTFHSFATEIINQNRQYFYNGAVFRPANDVNRFEIIESIFQALPSSYRIASTMNGQFTHLNDALRVVSELKSSGLTSEELLKVIEANNDSIEAIEAILVPILDTGIKKSTIAMLEPTLTEIKRLDRPTGVPGVVPLAKVLGDSLALALSDSLANDNSTKPITAWKNQWFKKDDKKDLILKSRERQMKLVEAADIYNQYVEIMQSAELFDFDDMILNVVHAMETIPELRYNLQEKYLYIMVDEFQDTNLAQMRILLDLINNPVNEDLPNIMVVGDDDQAIYGFQGATVGNIHNFIEKFPKAPRIVLTDNYRSVETILNRSREVISQGQNRLENLLPDINKLLSPRNDSLKPGSVELVELESTQEEHNYLVESITSRIRQGERPDSIAVLARNHRELIELLSYFEKAKIKVSYEKNDNVLELESIKLIEQVAEILIDILDGQLKSANAALPELLAHPAFGIDPEIFWKLSLLAQSGRKTWLEAMEEIPEVKPIKDWLIEESKAAAHIPLERMCDSIIGIPTAGEDHYTSPFFEYYFSSHKLESEPDLYLTHLNGLICLRSKLRDYYTDETPTLRSFLNFIKLQRQTGGAIVSTTKANYGDAAAINLMTAHKSKGLEFNTVYIVGAVDSRWGEKVRTRSRLINYPENLPLMPPGDNLDDRIRLFYVAMTRAKQNLVITYSTSDRDGREQLRASFLAGDDFSAITPNTQVDINLQLESAETIWYEPLVRPTTGNMRELLAPKLADYKLSASHLNNFLDITRGGPDAFLVENLLKFPAAPIPEASYGSAIHTALQRAHAHVAATGEQKPEEDILRDFETALDSQNLEKSEFEKYNQRGSEALSIFLKAKPDEFKRTQKTELNFGGQNAYIGDACLTGIIDVLDIREGSAVITDYKTGKPARNWKGASDYEKIKLHRYRQQLMFYELLVRHSRDFSKYTVEKSIIQFVDPTRNGEILSLETNFSQEELDRFKRLIESVWRHIVTLDIPDISTFEPSLKGIIEFEDSLID